jgi:hypothetical protein
MEWWVLRINTPILHHSSLSYVVNTQVAHISLFQQPV